MDMVRGHTTDGRATTGWGKENGWVMQIKQIEAGSTASPGTHHMPRRCLVDHVSSQMSVLARVMAAR
ncbi:hypothetical protein [Streptomyces anulatus]|uniref:hypothetical protein n=1 Tax=Streptomyces anulatus TaxID=1892 RepID=UPI0036C7BABA